MEVNSDILSLLKKVESGNLPDSLEDKIYLLKEREIIVEFQKDNDLNYEPLTDFKPTNVTLMPTTDCNLRCLYCYGSGGWNPSNMDQKIAKAAIDFIVENALYKKENKIHISFHGGGEPLLLSNWEFLDNTVVYAKKLANDHNLKVDFASATNGLLNHDQLLWVKANLDNIMLSFDGPKDIQNKQRPIYGGKDSYDIVFNSLNFFEEHNINYNIRSTITDYSVNRMKEIILFFEDVTNLKSFHLEPVSPSGRGKIFSYGLSDPNIFLENFIDALNFSKSKFIDVTYSGSKLEKISRIFCGAAGRNFFVTQDGQVTSCLEVMRASDDRSSKFFYGSYNTNTNKFNIDLGKLNYLFSRTVENIPYCSDCYAKYNCGGDCLAKIDTQGDMFDTSQNVRCEINRKLLKYQILDKL
jgi:uncharacterized protein